MRTNIKRNYEDGNRRKMRIKFKLPNKIMALKIDPSALAYL